MNKTRFEWDENKDAENQKKHSVVFLLAQFVFADPYRVIAEDFAHSEDEIRHFCFDEAAKHNTQYQRMIRRLVDAYVESYENAARSTQTARKRAAG